jgi:hypothetical protein
MRTLWTILSVLAIANLMAIAGVVGWLLATGRLDKERVTRLREVLSEPVQAERARLEAAAAQASQAEAEAAQAAREMAAPLSAAEQLQVRLDLSEVDHQRIERLRQETRDLTVTVSRNQERLAEERRGFEAERDAFDAMRAQLAQVEGSSQFRRAVATLQGLKPDEAVAILRALIDQGGAGGAPGDTLGGAVGTPGGESVPAFGGGIEQVVSYLNALQERSRNKILAEFIATDPALAADLLERLRTRGLIARGPEPAPS